jgi:hypothetical protein
MSVRATSFVLNLRGLSPTEKAVALVLAGHDSYKGHGAYPSMSTVAAEAGLKNRETASRITKRLVEKKVVLPDEPSRPEQGRPTVFRFNYDLATRDSRVTGGTPQACDSPARPPVTGPVTWEGPTHDSTAVENADPVTMERETCDSPVTQRVEGEKKEKENLEGEGGGALASSVSSATSPQVLLPLNPEIEKAFRSLRLKPFGKPEEQELFARFWNRRNGEGASQTVEAFLVRAKEKGMKLSRAWFQLKSRFTEVEIKNAVHPESIQERHSRRAAEATRGDWYPPSRSPEVVHVGDCDGYKLVRDAEGHSKAVRCDCKEAALAGVGK